MCKVRRRMLSEMMRVVVGRDQMLRIITSLNTFRENLQKVIFDTVMAVTIPESYLY